MADWEFEATINAIARTIAANHFEMSYGDLALKFTPYISDEYLSLAVNHMVDIWRIVTDGDGLLKVVLL
jgi:hypothetical protein